MLDTSAPATTVSTVAFSADTGTSSTDFITNTAAQTISGTLSAVTAAGEVVKVSLDNGTTWVTASNTVGQNTYSLAGQSLTASNTLQVRTEDAAGNTGTAKSQAYVLDTSAPATTVSTVAGDNIVNATEQTSAITGTNEAGATVALTIGGNTRAATVTGTTWSYTLVAADITAMGQGAETLSATQTDAAGNTSTAGTRTITVDTVAATVSTVAISSASGVQNSTLNAGDTVTVTASFSEAVTVTGTPQLALTIGGTTVQASYAGGTGTAALTFTYTILAGQTDTNGLAVAANALTLNSGTIKDAAGNNAALTHALAADNAGFLVDTTAPVFSSTVSASANGGSAIATTTTVYDANSTDNGGANDNSGITYSVAGSGVDNALFNISSTGLVTFKTSTSFAAPQDVESNNVYDITVRAADAAGNFTDKAVAITVTDGSINIYTSATVRDNSTSLGKLIASVTVDGGSTFYHWDRSGDGTSANTTSALTNVANDYMTHDILDGLFNKDSNGVTNNSVKNADGLYGTTDTYRYGTFYDINGAEVKVALLTVNGAGVAAPQGEGAYQNGTAIGNATASNGSNEANATYSDLLAVWDAYNGVSTSTNVAGVPPGWSPYSYWSATPSASGHAFVDGNSGYVYDSSETFDSYVALQVL